MGGSGIQSKAHGGKRAVNAGSKRAPARPVRRSAGAAVSQPPAAPVAPVEVVMRPGWREAIERTVHGLNYDIVEIERAPRGLLRIYIDRRVGQLYPAGESDLVVVEDCELVTRQLQYSLEVDGVEYNRLEVSSPGLDRPLRTPADYERFTGQDISITLKVPFQGRKVYKGALHADAAQAGWNLVFHDGKAEQTLTFTLDEVREARLVPVLDFKGRQGRKPDVAPAVAPAFVPSTATSEVEGGKD